MGPFGELDRRFGEAPAATKPGIRIDLCRGEVREAPGPRELVDVAGDTAEDPDHASVVDGDVVAVGPVLARPQVDDRRVTTGAKLLQPRSAVHQEGGLVDESIGHQLTVAALAVLRRRPAEFSERGDGVLDQGSAGIGEQLVDPRRAESDALGDLADRPTVVLG